MNDINIFDIHAFMKNRWKDQQIIADNVDPKKFKPKDYPVGAIYVPILGKVFVNPGEEFFTYEKSLASYRQREITRRHGRLDNRK